MQLPPPLRAAVDRALESAQPSELMSAVQSLSQRYRAEVRDGTAHLHDDLAALAYLGTRLPATYAAVRRSFETVATALPDFAPATMLDAGAGPGSAVWAAGDCWPTLTDAELIESAASIRTLGERLAAEAGRLRMKWSGADLAAGLPNKEPGDLVTLAYVLDELAPATRDQVVEWLWRLTAGVLVIVEPGTPRGWQRILRARNLLLAAGANLAAPCPHTEACPLIEPDWCHFTQRVARSQLHRRLKQADVPWEEEKFIYLAASRAPVASAGSRIIAPPQTATGRIMLKLCQPEGTVRQRLVTRREGAAFKAARRSGWGDTFEG